MSSRSFLFLFFLQASDMMLRNKKIRNHQTSILPFVESYDGLFACDFNGGRVIVADIGRLIRMSQKLQGLENFVPHIDVLLIAEC
jgi:hypothetical protein